MKIIMTFSNAKVNVTTDRVEKEDEKKWDHLSCFHGFILRYCP